MKLWQSGSFVEQRRKPVISNLIRSLEYAHKLAWYTSYTCSRKQNQTKTPLKKHIPNIFKYRCENGKCLSVNVLRQNEILQQLQAYGYLLPFQAMMSVPYLVLHSMSVMNLQLPFSPVVHGQSVPGATSCFGGFRRLSSASRSFNS